MVSPSKRTRRSVTSAPTINDSSDPGSRSREVQSRRTATASQEDRRDAPDIETANRVLVSKCARDWMKQLVPRSIQNDSERFDTMFKVAFKVCISLLGGSDELRSKLFDAEALRPRLRTMCKFAVSQLNSSTQLGAQV